MSGGVYVHTKVEAVDYGDDLLGSDPKTLDCCRLEVALMDALTKLQEFTPSATDVPAKELLSYLSGILSDMAIRQKGSVESPDTVKRMSDVAAQIVTAIQNHQELAVHYGAFATTLHVVKDAASLSFTPPTPIEFTSRSTYAANATHGAGNAGPLPAAANSASATAASAVSAPASPSGSPSPSQHSAPSKSSDPAAAPARPAAQEPKNSATQEATKTAHQESKSSGPQGDAGAKTRVDVKPESSKEANSSEKAAPTKESAKSGEPTLSKEVKSNASTTITSSRDSEVGSVNKSSTQTSFQSTSEPAPTSASKPASTSSSEIHARTEYSVSIESPKATPSISGASQSANYYSTTPTLTNQPVPQLSQPTSQPSSSQSLVYQNAPPLQQSAASQPTRVSTSSAALFASTGTRIAAYRSPASSNGRATNASATSTRAFSIAQQATAPATSKSFSPFRGNDVKAQQANVTRQVAQRDRTLVRGGANNSALTNPSARVAATNALRATLRVRSPLDSSPITSRTFRTPSELRNNAKPRSITERLLGQKLREHPRQERKQRQAALRQITQRDIRLANEMRALLRGLRSEPRLTRLTALLKRHDLLQGGKTNNALKRLLAKLRKIDSSKLESRDVRLGKSRSPFVLTNKLSKALLLSIRDVPIKELFTRQGQRDPLIVTDKRVAAKTPSTAEIIHGKQYPPSQKARIQNYLRNQQALLAVLLQDAPQLQKRLLHECTPGEIELLIELLGGSKARKALKKRKRGDDLTLDDITVDLLAELDSANAPSSSTPKASNATSEVSTAGEGATTHTGEQPSEGSGNQVAENTAPSATLDTVMVKQDG